MKNRSKQKGLAGPILAATVLLVGIVAALSLSNTSIRFRVFGNNKQLANNKAKNKLDQILNQPWSSDVDGSEGALSWTIASYGAGGRLKKITVISNTPDTTQSAGTNIKVVGYKYNDF
ncbi:hypothetical protein EBQ74_10995 [bacterium]|nr:hypothetical protein [bacterium]